MFGDLLELTTTLINPEHDLDLSQNKADPSSSSKSSSMPPRRGHSKTGSVSSNVELNGMPPLETPTSKAVAAVRKPRRRSTTSPPSSPVTLKAPVQIKNIHVQQSRNPLQLLLVVVQSTLVEALLKTVASRYGTGELASISKHSESWIEVGGLLGWKVAQLTFYWFAGFDAYDVASLTLLLSTPPAILLGLFYQIRPTTLAITTATSIFSTSLPWFLFKPLSPHHSPSSAPKSSIRNRPILTDPYTTIATSLLATAIFAVLLEASFATFLPTWLIVNFNGLRSLEAAHLGATGLPTLLLALIPAGIACMEFLFAPSTAAQEPVSAVSTTGIDQSAFDPATATFAAHLRHNAWGWYSSRQKALIARTTILAVLMTAECVIQLWGTIQGAELIGTLGYAGVWGLGVAVLGTVLDWVGGPSD